MEIPLLITRFQNHIQPFEVPLFRGAVIASLDRKPLLFHDHDGTGLRYAYPLIQYKRIDGRAAIVCLGLGTEDIGEFFTSEHFTLRLGQRVVKAELDSVTPATFDVCVEEEQQHRYRLRQWLPFNSDNYRRYRQTEALSERIALLERVLTGNILSFCKGMGISVKERIVCQITDLISSKATHAKGVRMEAMNADFQTNIALPPLIGLGKHVSIGYGTLEQLPARKE